MKRKIFRKEKSGYTLGLIFCLLGIILLAVVVWKIFTDMSSSQSLISNLWSYLWTQQIDFPLGASFKLIFFWGSGVAVLLTGTLILVISHKWFNVSGGNVWLTCPYCKNRWQTNRAKGRVECPHCRQFIQPQVMKTS